MSLRTVSLLPVLLATLLSGATVASGQTPLTVIDARTPLEMTAGTAIEDDLLLVGALFSSPNQISVFRSPSDGLGPWIEEIAVASGDPYFALSRRILCRESVCYFTAVNAATLNVELFSRPAGTGLWTRQTVTSAGVYYNSDLGFNLDALTILAYDAISFENEVWRSVGGGPFAPIALHGDAAGAIYGTLRSTLAADEESGDYLITFDNLASIALSFSLRGWQAFGHYPADLVGPEFVPDGGTALTRQVGLVADILFSADLEPVTNPGAGDPSTLREAAALHTCGLIVVTYQDSEGDVWVVFRDAATGDLLAPPASLGAAPLTQDSGIAPSIRILKNSDSVGIFTFAVDWADGRASIVTLDTAAGFVDVSHQTLVSAVQLGALGSTHTEADEVDLVSAVPEGGGTGVYLVDRSQITSGALQEIPTLGETGMLGLALMILAAGFLRLRS